MSDQAGRPLTVPELIAATGGHLTLCPGPHLGVCCRCRANWTDADASGTPRLCRPCTVAEIGEPLDELAQRVTAGKTLAQWGKLPRDDDGRVIFTPRRK